MAVHSIRVYTDTDVVTTASPNTGSPEGVGNPPELPEQAADEAKNRLSEVFSGDKLTETLPEQATDPSVRNSAEDGSGTDYIEFIKRADTTFDTKQDVIDFVENEVVFDAEWSRIEYHKCYNDEHRPCEGWEIESEQGTVPSDI